LDKTFQEEALYELHFWLQILENHSQFIHDSLAPNERENIETANSFKEWFAQSFAVSKEPVNEQQLYWLLEQTKNASEEIRNFKLQLLKDQLVGTIHISLTPTFINHMVNEVEEAIRLFSYLEEGQKPPAVHPLHHDLLWLLDAAGHAGAIDANLDLVEKQLKKDSRDFTKEWEDFYLKAVELAGFLRTNVTKFPALDRFHDDIQLEMELFKTFLRELEEMGLKKESLGTLTPLMADHMAREESYYLLKLAETTK
jgi:Domain of unknown function (DUF2935)